MTQVFLHRAISVIRIHRAEREIGFKAKTSFEEGLKKTVEWYMDQNKRVRP